MHQPPNLSMPPLDRLRAIVHTLRAPGGCPWDIEQTQTSLIPNILEEAYEAVDAIRSGNVEHMREELGDLLLQVIMQCEIASESKNFILEDVASDVSEKLVRRHPHVFGDAEAEDTESVLRRWDEIKSAEKGSDKARVLDDLPHGIPSLMKAIKIQKKVERIGFDWPNAESVIPKIREELDEVEIALREGGAEVTNDNLAEELGDLLFAVTNLTRKLGMDSESLLASANEKFVRRFDALETVLENEGTNVINADTKALEQAWGKAKKQIN